MEEMGQERIFPEIDPAIFLPPRNATMADTFYDRLQEHLEKAMASLQSDEELSVYYYTQGGIAWKIEDVGFHNPFLIKLYCRGTDGSKTSILLHMAAVQLVVRISKKEKDVKRVPIGFRGSEG